MIRFHVGDRRVERNEALPRGAHGPSSTSEIGAWGGGGGGRREVRVVWRAMRRSRPGLRHLAADSSLSLGRLRLSLPGLLGFQPSISFIKRSNGRRAAPSRFTKRNSAIEPRNIRGSHA